MRNTYCIFWKTPLAPERGTIWLWVANELLTFAGFPMFDEGIPFRHQGYRAQLLQARGVNWAATWARVSPAGQLPGSQPFSRCCRHSSMARCWLTTPFRPQAPRRLRDYTSTTSGSPGHGA